MLGKFQPLDRMGLVLLCAIAAMSTSTCTVAVTGFAAVPKTSHTAMMHTKNTMVRESTNGCGPSSSSSSSSVTNASNVMSLLMASSMLSMSYPLPALGLGKAAAAAATIERPFWQEAFLAFAPGLPMVIGVVGVLVFASNSVKSELKSDIDSLKTSVTSDKDALETKIETKTDALEKKIETKTDALEKKIETEIGSVTSSLNNLTMSIKSVQTTQDDVIKNHKEEISNTLTRYELDRREQYQQQPQGESK